MQTQRIDFARNHQTCCGIRNANFCRAAHNNPRSFHTSLDNENRPEACFQHWIDPPGKPIERHHLECGKRCGVDENALDIRCNEIATFGEVDAAVCKPVDQTTPE